MNGMKPKQSCGIGSIGPKPKSGKRGKCLCGGRLKYQGLEGKNYFRWKCKDCNKDIVADKDGTVLPDPHKGETIDFLCEQDKRHFKTHSEDEYYDRAAHPAEFPKKLKVPANSNVYVRVFDIVPGFRVRVPWVLAAGEAKETLLEFQQKQKRCSLKLLNSEKNITAIKQQRDKMLVHDISVNEAKTWGIEVGPNANAKLVSGATWQDLDILDAIAKTNAQLFMLAPFVKDTR
jgi:hypothetical protein